MSQSNNIRVENLVYTLKELQNEKLCLEQKLQEQELKKRSLEQELEQEWNRCVHVQEKHGRMAGTFAVAQQKVDTTLAACMSLQAEIEKSKPDLERLQGAIENEKAQQHDNIKRFEAALADISAQLFQARDIYKKAALQDEINNAKKATEELQRKADMDNREIQRMKRKLESLILESSTCKTSNFACEQTLQACFSAMERDRQEAEEYREKVRAELQEIQCVLNAEN